MRSTAELVDQFKRVDLPKYEGDLMKLLDGYTPKNDMPSEKEEGLVRAGIAYIFYKGLKDVVKESEKRYMKGYRDKLKEEEKRIEKETGREPRPKMSEFKNWSFDDFVNRMAAPYWKISPDELWSYGDLAPLMDTAPAFTQVVISADDPLAKPEDIEALKQRFPEPKLIVLPHGGHMGFCGTKWLKTLIWKTFKP
jgi:predicted alpha/beta-fold hydrolase